ncbi:calcium-activated potassium channel subunit alpha-1-like isoform X2 [Selaginella moellendorffii]|uniref:calcium-activated potassium channel subunit alpha-1-like isoform X2 n=1 Tax=Selaginella moellendorffii TaxID=88036 RepID=UPI000D1CF372|nr:calcium-activated potassium channel subunit alpha-1-like isoform X2 [Selaginella moellendorffii]|eukprot:XP_024516267.1 calcium-activated potassium channel subunit alpha-1-like isoform X2 [Selaginella moellendorffii]
MKGMFPGVTALDKDGTLDQRTKESSPRDNSCELQHRKMRKAFSDAVLRYGRSDMDNENMGFLERSKMVEVTVPALDSSGMNATRAGTKSLTRSRTLLITPTGQCTPVLEDDLEFDLEAKHAEFSLPRERENKVPEESSLGKFRGSVKYVLLQSLLWLKDQTKEKEVNATEDVLARYHNLYLYGTVPLTIKVRTAIRSGTLGHILLCIEFIAAVVSVVAYVRSTYILSSTHWIVIVRRVFGLFFVADYLLKLYSAPVRLYYVISVSGLIDLSSTLSIVCLWSKFKNDGAIPQMLLVLRALRILPSLTSFVIVGGTIGQQIFLLVMYTLGAVFIAAGILQWVEYKTTSADKKIQQGCGVSGCFTFYDAFYFVIVTITTVGYGDFTPKSNWGRLITLTIMLAAVLILPVQINRILQLASRRPYGGRFTMQKAVGSNFIVISGNVSLQTIRHFLAGFYHPNHDKDMAAFPIRVVIMAPFKPSYEMKTLLTHYRGRVNFIEGTPIKESDLDRVCATFATAVFLLADEHAKDFDAEDAAQITRTLSVHRHCGSKVRVIVELLKPENYNNAIWDETEAGIEIICPEAVRFQLLARSCLIQGFSTLVINLFRSGLLLRHSHADHWMTEYCYGVRQEIFPAILPACFFEEKLTFEEAAEIVYLKYHAVLIGLDIILENKLRVVRLYPRGRRIKPSDLGLVIAKDLEMAERISEYGKARRRSSGKFKHEEDHGILRSVKGSRQDVETGFKSRDRGRRTKRTTTDDHLYDDKKDSTRPGTRTDFQGHFRPFYSSIDSVEEEGHSKVKFVASLEEAIDMAMSWPPLRKWDKPERPVLERREDTILENLREKTINVVVLSFPHILLCIEGNWPLNLFYFICNLRIPTMPQMPLVIMHPSTPTAADWGCVGLFVDVYFVKGSALYELDLVRAGVLQAEKVVILTQGFEDDFQPVDDAAGAVSPTVNTLDVKNIVITANVERLLSPARNRVLVELQQEIQLQFLRPHSRNHTVQFQPKTLQRDRDARLQFAPPFAEGKGLCPAAFTFLTYATFFNRNSVSIIEQLSCGRHTGEDEDGDENSIRRLEQIPIPSCYVGLSFQQLFQGLLHNEKALALGLYRPVGTHNSPVAYVSTNPAYDTLLHSGDLIYVLQ